MINSNKLIRKHYLKLKKANSKLSIRALAPKLDVSHTFLNKILNGSAKVPINKISKLIEVFKIDQIDAENLKKLVIKEKLNTEIKFSSESNEKGTQDYENIPESHISLMFQWWNLAILDLITCDLNCNYNSETISLLLPIGKQDIEASLEKLEKFGLIQKQKYTYIKTSTKLRFSTTGPTPATKEFYRQCLNLANKELNKTTQSSYENRLVLGFTCAANKKQIPIAKQQLAAALRNCAETLAQGECDDVFIVQGQLFSVLS